MNRDDDQIVPDNIFYDLLGLGLLHNLLHRIGWPASATIGSSPSTDPPESRIIALGTQFCPLIKLSTVLDINFQFNNEDNEIYDGVFNL